MGLAAQAKTDRADKVGKMSRNEAQRFVLAIAEEYAQMALYIDQDSMRRFCDRARMLMEDFRLTEM